LDSALAQETAGPGRGAADVVDQDVDPLAGRAGQGGGTGRVGQVHRHELHLAAGGQLRQLGRRALGPRDDPRPGTGQRPADGQADPLAGPGHDGRPAGKFMVHDALA
jgi:hypothetical protein